MIDLVISDYASSDAEEILAYLHRGAGLKVAEAYARRFEVTLQRLKNYPELGAPRSSLGKDCRIAIVSPYILIYDLVREENRLILLRILHGHRGIHERFLRR